MMFLPFCLVTSCSVMIIMYLVFTQAILELQSEKYLKTVDEDEVLRMDQKDKSLFVFSSFSSPAFLHCKKVRQYSQYIISLIMIFR